MIHVVCACMQVFFSFFFLYSQIKHEPFQTKHRKSHFVIESRLKGNTHCHIFLLLTTPCHDAFLLWNWLNHLWIQLLMWNCQVDDNVKWTMYLFHLWWLWLSLSLEFCHDSIFTQLGLHVIAHYQWWSTFNFDNQGCYKYRR